MFHRHLIITAALVTSAFGATKSSPNIPPAPLQPLKVSKISLGARNVASGQARGAGVAPSTDSTRTTTAHEATLEISAKNLGTQTQAVTLRWFWLGRYETSKNWFRSGDGEKVVTLDPSKATVFVVDNVDVESHQTKGGSSYVSGGRLFGWVVTASNSKGETEVVRVSDSLYLGFATTPPPKMRKARAATAASE